VKIPTTATEHAIARHPEDLAPGHNLSRRERSVLKIDLRN